MSVGAESWCPGEDFDLFTTGIGYLKRVREVTPPEGSPFWSVTIAALRGPTDAVQYTRFECRVSGKQAQELMPRFAEAVTAERHVLIGFTLSGLVAEPSAPVRPG